MSDPNKDRMLADLRDSLPPLWYSLYQGSIDAGFDSAQALHLVSTFILSTNVKNVYPAPPEPPKEEQP